MTLEALQDMPSSKKSNIEYIMHKIAYTRVDFGVGF
jgi:hypothetical protein